MPAFIPPFPPPTPQTVQRLSFVRYLHQLAVQQSEQPEPMAAASVLSLHDSAELLLQIAAEAVNANLKTDTPFMAYFEEIERKLGEPLSSKVAMRRLNEARRGIKHSGLMPPHHEIEGFRGSVTTFLEDTTLLVFKMRFGAISMVNLVANGRVRGRLQKAESAIATEAYEDAAVDLSWSFEVLVRDYEAERADQYGRSLFDKSPQFSRSGFEEFRELREAIDGVRSQVRILALGIDLHRYLAFQHLVPSPWWTLAADEPSFYEGQLKEPASEAGCRFCLEFVMDSALRLQGSPVAGRPPPQPSAAPRP